MELRSTNLEVGHHGPVNTKGEVCELNGPAFGSRQARLLLPAASPPAFCSNAMFAMVMAVRLQIKQQGLAANKCVRLRIATALKAFAVHNPCSPHCAIVSEVS